MLNPPKIVLAWKLLLGLVLAMPAGKTSKSPARGATSLVQLAAVVQLASVALAPPSHWAAGADMGNATAATTKIRPSPKLSADLSPQQLPSGRSQTKNSAPRAPGGCCGLKSALRARREIIGEI